MSKDRSIDDAELANISGAGGGNIHVEPSKDPTGTVADASEVKPPEVGSGGGGTPSGLENDAETGGDEDFGIG